MAGIVRTAAQMAQRSGPTIADYQVDQLVHHPKYGDGMITKMTGRGPKCMVTVEFEGDGESYSKTFRLMFAELSAR